MSPAFAEKLTINAAEVPAMSAVATDTASGKKFTGTLSGDNFVFDLKPGRHYDVTLKKLGGGVVRVIDLSWYADEAAPADAQPLSEDDRKQIAETLTGIARFTNRNQILALVGDSSRAVALLDLRRDNDFHSGGKGELIRRIEVWYFKNEAGGWAKVPQQDRVIDRERFTSAEEFDRTFDSETWLPLANGLAIERGKESVVALKAAATTKPAR